MIRPLGAARPPAAQRGGILLWLGGGLVLVGAVIVGGIAGYWLFLNLWFGMTIKNQPLAVTLPETLPVTAEVTNVLDIDMNGVIHAKVPFDKKVVVPFRGNYDIDINLDTLVPVSFAVDYNGVIPVDTMATIEARTDLNFKTIKKYRDLKIKAKLPLKFDLPVHLHVPVNDNLHFVYNGPIKAAINQNINTRVNTTLNTALRVDQTVHTPVKRSFGLRLHLPQHPVRARIDYSKLHINLDSLRLGLAEDNNGPQRQASPYGPAAQ